MSKIILTEQSAPSTPETTKGEIYIKVDGLLYFKNDSATEYALTTTLAVPLYSQANVVHPLSNVTVGDGQAYIHIPAGIGGMDLIEVHAEVITAGSGGTTDIQIENITQAANMLSTVLTIDSGETGSDEAVIPAVIDTANDDVVENDLLGINVTNISSTAPKGLYVTLGFRAPS